MGLVTWSFILCSFVLAISADQTIYPTDGYPDQTTTTSPLSCPPDWLNAHNEGCFQFLVDEVNLTWTGAMSACEVAGGYLAEPKTQKQMEFLAVVADLVMDLTGVTNWWLGLTDLGHEGRWEWIHSFQVNITNLHLVISYIGRVKCVRCPSGVVDGLRANVSGHY